MNHSIDILLQNKDFLMNAYNIGPLFGFLMVMGLVDMGLKGWGMWRAARMQKKWWFIALLVVNSIGILPTIFLVMTNDEYVKKILDAPKKGRGR